MSLKSISEFPSDGISNPFTITHSGKQRLMERAYERYKQSTHHWDRMNNAYMFFTHALHLKEWIQHFSGKNDFVNSWKQHYASNQYYLKARYKLMKILFYTSIVFTFLSCRNENEDYLLPEIVDVNYNNYDTTNCNNGDKVFLTKYDGSTSDSVLIGKSTPDDIIKLFGAGKIDTVFEHNLTTSNIPENNYVVGKWISLAYEDKGLRFSFQKPHIDGESPEEILTSKDNCLLKAIKLVSPSDYYLDNVFTGMSYDAVIRKFGIPSWNIQNGIVYDAIGLRLTFDKKVYKNDTTARLKEIARLERRFFKK